MLLVSLAYSFPEYCILWLIFNGLVWYTVCVCMCVEFFYMLKQAEFSFEFKVLGVTLKSWTPYIWISLGFPVARAYPTRSSRMSILQVLSLMEYYLHEPWTWDSLLTPAHIWGSMSPVINLAPTLVVFGKSFNLEQIMHKGDPQSSYGGSSSAVDNWVILFSFWWFLFECCILFSL